MVVAVGSDVGEGSGELVSTGLGSTCVFNAVGLGGRVGWAGATVSEGTAGLSVDVQPARSAAAAAVAVSFRNVRRVIGDRRFTSYLQLE